MTESWSSQGARLSADAIKTMMRYLPARFYHLKLVPNDRQNFPVITRYLTRTQLFKSVGFLRWKNAEGYHIYFRPDADHFVYIDDVCREDIQIMIKDSVRPVLVYETSEDLHHAWIQLANRPEQVTEDEARHARIILAECYSGDKNATGKNQPGRLPGFRNVKPMHEDDKGGHPLVVIKRSCFAPVATKILEEAKKRIASSSKLPPSATFGGGVNSRNLRDACNKNDIPLEIYDRGQHVVTMSAKYEIGDLRTAYGRALNEMMSSGYVSPIRHSGVGIDRSKQDFNIARFLISNLVSEEVIIEILMHGSEKATERGMDYVIRTVSNVCHLIDQHTHST